MTGAEAKAIRKALGLSEAKGAELLASSLGRGVSRTTLQNMEKRERVPDDVAALLGSLAPAGTLDGLEPEQGYGTGDGAAGIPLSAREDTAPGGAAASAGAAAPVLFDGGAYAKICTEFWELIATGVGMVGAATGNPTLQRDGLIIDADKEALGAAWGKLAETNEVFRRMIQASEQQGAYLAVALATGTTVGKVWRNHQEAVERALSADEALRQARQQAAENGAQEAAGAAVHGLEVV